MIYPIVAYGDPVLKKEAEEIDENYPDLDKLIENMFETMYNAAGVGLAAPQIGKSIRLFIVDASPFAEEEKDLEDFKRVFINPEILDEDGKKWSFNEGCLSIPGVREDVNRQPELEIEYYDEHFELKTEKLTGLAARVVQHEYDHIDGILFTDHLTPLKRRLLKGKLKDISKGIVSVDYNMRFPDRRK
ncbi:MAG: peptide deformylase [Bacteroidia bacterium]|nr:peptide deformylase [Bacteroidia bacterium]NNC85911.1 peptide deformylase [Bacteroidia bacterium]NNM16408.1 peptide deformylase [Bacteroidia bacterium]